MSVQKFLPFYIINVIFDGILVVIMVATLIGTYGQFIVDMMFTPI